MTYRPIPAAEYLRTVFDYEPETGILIWRDRPWVRVCTNNRFVGKTVGTITQSGLSVRLDGVSYLLHRIIYVMVHGDVLGVDDEIDHKDLNNRNNKLENIRKATHSQNMANVNSIMASSGVKGVDLLPGGTYRVRIAETHIGCYPDLESARAAYNMAAKLLYGEFGRPA